MKIIYNEVLKLMAIATRTSNSHIFSYLVFKYHCIFLLFDMKIQFLIRIRAFQLSSLANINQI